MLRDVDVEESSVRPESIVEWQGTVRTGQGVERDGGEALREEVEILRTRQGDLFRGIQPSNSTQLFVREITGDAGYDVLCGRVRASAIRSICPNERNRSIEDVG